MPRLTRAHRPALTALVVGLLLAATIPAARAAEGSDAKVTRSSAEASRALATARASLDGSADGAPSRDATVALRDLTLHYRELSATDRLAANRLLARPTTTQQTCNSDICVHWSDTGPDASTSAWADLTLSTLQHVRDVYRGAGYRYPLTDGTRGGDARLDVYLSDTGKDDVYGYCTTDPGSAPQSAPWVTFAYCELDNDFSADQFPGQTPQANLEVTAAHEYFHATQFAYDYAEDRWLLEATAVWAEDELYDDADDNLQYLPSGPLGRPRVPLDLFESGGAHHYGDWIFFRYLTERLPESQGGLPTLVRDVWERAGGATGDPDDYSVQAVETALTGRGTSLEDQFTAFSDGNLRSRTTYEEGSANRYPVVSPTDRMALSPRSPSSHLRSRSLDHLTSTSARFKPNKTNASYQLRVRVDFPTRARSAAVVTVTSAAGATTTYPIALNSRGDGSVRVPFGVNKVSRVDLTMVNTGTRYDCWRGTSYACQGRSLDDGKKTTFSALASS